MFSIGETRPNCDANGPQEDAQVTTNFRRGRLNNETPEQRERRLQMQREQRRRRRHQETREHRQHRLAQRRQRRQEETEEQRNRRLEYHRQYNQGRRALETVEDRQFRLDLTRARFNNETPVERELRLHRIRSNQAQRLINETEQERDLRLQTLRTNQEQRLLNETEQERNLRLQTVRTNQTQRRINETEQERQVRLQTLRTNQAQRRITETEQERQIRLQTLRTNQTQRLINETEQERDLRLQTLRTNQFIRIQAESEQQRHDRLQIARDNTGRRIEVETNEERQNRLQLLQQNGVMYRENERLQHVQDQINRDSYISNGWRNAEQPLHEQQWVHTEMANFHRAMNKLEHRQCVICKEAWPTNNGLTLQSFECLRCKRDKGNPKSFSQENDMDPGCLPTALQGLTEIEEMLIARACPIMCVYRKHGGQRGYKGHVLNLPQDIQGFLSRLPPNIAQLPYLIIRKHGADNTHRDCRVRRQKVLEAITWLKDNNPFYAGIQIDYEALHRLPIDGVPSDLPTAEDPEQNAEEHTADEDTSQNNNDGEDSQHSHSFLPLPQAQRSEQDAIRALINGEDPLDWPSNDDDPINEFRTEGLATMAFPTLFPYGKGDPTKKTRLREVSLTEGFKHLIKYVDRSTVGTFSWRFASHPRFPYWALNMKQRHQLLSQARIYLTQNPEDSNLTIEELRQMVGQMSANQLMNRLQRYVAKIQGTKQYWYQRYQELKALITQKGAPTFFFTFSAADNYWPDLHRLLQEPNNATPSIPIKAVIDNPHLTDSYFVSRLDEFSNVWLDRVLHTEWKWYRFEWQARGSIHAHGCAKLTNDPGLCNLVNTAVQGWKLERILQLQMEQPTYEQMAADFQPQIEAGYQATTTVINYADWLVTTINEAIPQENWVVPSPHPSSLLIENVQNFNDDYQTLVNSVERHTKCSTAYCLRKKPGQEATCRFNFPKDCQEETSLDFQLIRKAGSDDHELTVEEVTQARVKITLTT